MKLLKNERVGNLPNLGTSRVYELYTPFLSVRWATFNVWNNGTISVSTELKIQLSNLFNNLQKERGELTPLSHFQPFHWQVCNINPT